MRLRLLTSPPNCNIINKLIEIFIDFKANTPVKFCEVDNGRGEIGMSEVRVGENESLESALRRFKRQCARAGVMAEIRKREHYEKPIVKRKKKA